GPSRENADAYSTPNPSTASQQILFADRSIQIELSQPLYPVVTLRVSAHVNRIHRTSGKSRPAKLRPRVQIGGNLHLVDQAGLCIPKQKHTLRSLLQSL